ncbi:hypothetical protein KFE25_010110 [Diacronema lutheri]|uniref:TAFII55 protein conserved region domain-containing protein n=1 Tax=Diacronema lutheri TaxID=2081491 RepID=A0A8J5XIE6_DIALT|nr:hypothetical protein KFE25_010110 [Diacronema lutheri]
MEDGAAAEEEAYVLRLPLPLAARVRELMQAPGATREMAMHVQFVEQPGFVAGRLARVRIGEDYFPATLMDLPTVVESAKSVDGMSYYKCGHVSQMLVVSEMMMTPAPPPSYVARDGLTPPARGIRDFWAANQPINPHGGEGTAEVERVEAKLKRILDGQGGPLDDEPPSAAAGAQPAASVAAGERALLFARAAGDTAAGREASAAAALGMREGAVATSVPGAATAGAQQHTFQDLFGDSSDDSDESDPVEDGMDA